MHTWHSKFEVMSLPEVPHLVSRRRPSSAKYQTEAPRRLARPARRGDLGGEERAAVQRSPWIAVVCSRSLCSVRRAFNLVRIGLMVTRWLHGSRWVAGVLWGVPEYLRSVSVSLSQLRASSLSPSWPRLPVHGTNRGPGSCA